MKFLGSVGGQEPEQPPTVDDVRAMRVRQARERTKWREVEQTRLVPRSRWLVDAETDELGLGRRAVDAVFRACPNILIPGYSRPQIRVEDYLRHLEGWTYRDDRPYPHRDY